MILSSCATAQELTDPYNIAARNGTVYNLAHTRDMSTLSYIEVSSPDFAQLPITSTQSSQYALQVYLQSLARILRDTEFSTKFKVTLEDVKVPGRMAEYRDGRDEPPAGRCSDCSLHVDQTPL